MASDLSQRIAPSTDLEHQLHTIWADVLGHSDFGCNDLFWLVGGHSLSATALAARIEQTFGTAMPLGVIFSCPTVSAQAAWLLNPSQQLRKHLLTLQPLGSRPPLYVVHGWGGIPGFTDLARALAPHRPVLGLQAGRDGQPPQGASVTTLTAAYAQEILAAHRGGPIHLMGHSAGGWYAFAVAAALLQLEAPLGVIAILDTHATTRIHRRLGLSLFSRMLGSRLPVHLQHLLQPPPGQRRRRYVLNRLHALNAHAGHYLRVRMPEPQVIKARMQDISAASPDPFTELLMSGFKPPRLPLAVDLFGPEDSLPKLHRLWQFYARGGVHCRPLFEDHFDFTKPVHADQLAAALETTLQQRDDSDLHSHEGSQPVPRSPTGRSTRRPAQSRAH